MSLTATQTSTLEHSGPRKRTSSFCYSLQLSGNPRPAKAPRLSKSMGSALRRTETYISLSDVASSSSKRSLTSSTSCKAASEHSSPIHMHRDQKGKERRKASVNHAVEPLSIRLSPQLTIRPTTTAIRPFTPVIPLPSKAITSLPPTSQPTAQPSSSQHAAPLASAIKCPTLVTACSALPTSQRHSSPLAPAQEPRPSRPQFPRSKPEPDLYKKALRTCMKSSPEGQKILRMGPRLAISIMTATRELERIVAAQEQREQEIGDDAMAVDSHPVLSKSWVLIPDQDWEMVDCSA